MIDTLLGLGKFLWRKEAKPMESKKQDQLANVDLESHNPNRQELANALILDILPKVKDYLRLKNSNDRVSVSDETTEMIFYVERDGVKIYLKPKAENRGKEILLNFAQPDSLEKKGVDKRLLPKDGRPYISFEKGFSFPSVRGNKSDKLAGAQMSLSALDDSFKENNLENFDVEKLKESMSLMLETEIKKQKAEAQARSDEQKHEFGEENVDLLLQNLRDKIEEVLADLGPSQSKEIYQSEKGSWSINSDGNLIFWEKRGDEKPFSRSFFYYKLISRPEVGMPGVPADTTFTESQAWSSAEDPKQSFALYVDNITLGRDAFMGPGKKLGASFLEKSEAFKDLLTFLNEEKKSK